MFSFFERRLNPFPPEAEGGEPTPPPGRFWAFMGHYLKDAGPWFAGLGVLVAAISVGEVLLFAFLGQLVDWLTDQPREGFLAREAATLWPMLGLAVVVLPCAVFLSSLIQHQTILGNMPMSARWRMHRWLLGQSMSFFSNEFAGRVATRLMQTALAVREVASKLLDVFVYVAVYFISVVVLMGATDWRFTIPLLAWLAVYATLLSVFIPRLARLSERQADARSAMTGRIVDSYTNIATVKLFSHAGREEGHAREAMGEFLQTVHPQMRLVTAFHSLVYLNNSVLVAAMAGTAIWLWQEALAGVGAMAVGIALCLRINGMSQWIMWEVAGLFENIGVVQDGMEMLTRRRAVTDRAGAPELAVREAGIGFEGVSFHYGKAGGVIEGLDLAIAPGERIGLVGRSGAGKTTLVNLLLRFHDVEGGRILIDGQDVAGVTQDSLRAAIGVVTQDTSLLHRSIRDNIAYGRPHATQDDIVAAAGRARALDFIAGLEDSAGRKGFEAHTGERGVRLSGGQRQRIAIARLFLKDAPILILDEATSALDSEVEAAIQENLFGLMQGKTVIAIAHRLSTIAQMDRLVVLDQGRIVEQGTHEDLLRTGGLYARLWERQSGGFLPTIEGLAPQPETAGA
jgi:ATP-binding cassette subfamily B multidrug efflux pump